MLQTSISICKEIIEKGYEAVFAGGIVRDILLNKNFNDIDIATNAKPEIIEEIFKPNAISIGRGKEHGTITILRNNYQFQVTTYRKDGDYSDSRHCDNVEFSNSMEEDSKRRDFTINAMYLNPINNVIYDYNNGKKDLDNGIIRFVGNAEDRIKEHPSRLLRALRFASKYNFNINHEDRLKIIELVKLIKLTPIETIRMELEKSIITENVKHFMDLFFETKLMLYTLPDIYRLKNVKQGKRYHPEGDVLIHTILCMKEIKPNLELRLAAMFHDIGKYETQSIESEEEIHFYQHEKVSHELCKTILHNMTFSNEIVEKVSNLVKNHMLFFNIQVMKKSTLARLFKEDYFDDLLELHKADTMSSDKDLSYYNYAINKRKEFDIRKIQVPDINLLNGNDLIELGFKPGPIFKEILTNIENLQIEDNIKTKEEAINYVKTIYINK